MEDSRLISKELLAEFYELTFNKGFNSGYAAALEDAQKKLAAILLDAQAQLDELLHDELENK
jgi:flagellar biosynthesis/type III secretory pathway protein FliH